MKFQTFPVLAFCSLSASVSSGAEPKAKDPADFSKGTVHEWKSADGLAYQYRIPAKYDAKAGANLTFVLHGSNLTRAWGFANHDPKTFRPDDVVVCPDGTSANGQGGFNFMGKEPDVERLRALHSELKAVFKINATFLYGHSQGSFFALHYAGAKPEEIQGVVAHASGLWTWTPKPETAHHQAIVFLHGTQDPVVPYGQSVGGYEALKKSGYPNVRLRSLEGWNHWPAEQNGPIPHASQQLAWVEGMTTEEPARLAAAFKTLSPAKSKEQHDFAALYLFAARIAKMADASAGVKNASGKAMAAVEALAEEHAAELAKIDPDGEIAVSDGAWIRHLPMFLRAFAGVPQADALGAKWKPVLDAQRETVNQELGAYHTALQSGDKAAAFAAGLKALRGGFLTVNCADQSFLANMNAWLDDAKGLGIDKEDAAAFKTLSRDYRKALEDGQKAFEAINRKASF